MTEHNEPFVAYPDLDLPEGIRFWVAFGPDHSYEWSTRGQQDTHLLAQTLGVERVTRMHQTHSTRVIDVDRPLAELSDVDGCVSRTYCSLAVMTADCLPLLACDASGTSIGACHAGWRGLAQGIIPRWLSVLGGATRDLRVWIGPAISQSKFQVGAEVVDAFGVSPHFKGVDIQPYIAPDDSRADASTLNLVGLALAQLRAFGVGNTAALDECTATSSRCFSYRRDATPRRILTGVTKSPS